MEWPDFCQALNQAYDAGIIDHLKLASLGWVFQRLGPWATNERQYVVLLVDELVKVEEGLLRQGVPENQADIGVNNIRHELCVTMDTAPFQVAFSTLSVKPMELETRSNRTVTRLGLPLLSFEEAEALLKSSLSPTFLVGLTPAGGDSEELILIHAWLARLSGGHPRTIEVLSRTVSNLIAHGTCQIRHAVQATEANIITKYYEPLSLFSWELFLAVLVGQTVFLRSPIPGSSSIGDFDKAIEYGYLINAAPQEIEAEEGNIQESTIDAVKIQPRVSELQLRALLHVFVADRAQGTPKIIFDFLRMLLDTVDDIDGKKFEVFHMSWEIMRRNAIVEATTWTTARVIDFYGCRCYRGPLAETEIVLTEAPHAIKHFPRVASWNIISKAFSECPPARDHPELLLFVWYPARDDFPGLDFVIFVRACDGRIIPLVFQSKYSAEDSTNTLGNDVVSESYEVAKKIMKHAGWEPDEFIFVVHAYRDITGNVLGAEPTHTMSTRSAYRTLAPVANMMLLDKLTLQHLYGSLEFTIQYAWLKNSVKCDARPDTAAVCCEL